MRVASDTDKGLIRKENQDNLRVCEFDGNVLAVVCDGMGGERSGSTASTMAVDIIIENFLAGYKKISTFNNTEDFNSIRKLMSSSVADANFSIHYESSHDISKKGMGTTCVFAYVTENTAHIVNVGDSRAYLVRGEDIIQITKDHTRVQQLFDKGQISLSEMESHPHKNMLVRAVGVEKTVDVDYFSTDFRKEDIIILCSDGLSGYCGKSEIYEKVRSYISIDEVCRKLIELAMSKGGRDNVSVVIIAY